MSRLSQEPQTTGSAKAKKRSSLLAPNPIMRRLDKVDEYDAAESATYGGIALKTVYFLLFSIVGIIAQVALKDALSGGSIVELEVKSFKFTMTTYEIFAILGVTVAAIVFQLLAFFARSTTPVTGALYCVTQGYFIAFIIFTILPEDYHYLGLLALAITMMIVLVMAILYATGIIRVTKKFKMVMLTLIVTSVGTSLLLFIGSFIPVTRELVGKLAGNYTLSIVFGVIFIIIAALFLICDFDTIDNVVKNKLPKKYEWAAAFGLSFTVLWLYLKVLDIILSIVGSNRN